jgi:hypothetical protein
VLSHRPFAAEHCAQNRDICAIVILCVWQRLTCGWNVVAAERRGKNVAGGASRAERRGNSVAGGASRQERRGRNVAGGASRHERRGRNVAGGASRWSVASERHGCYLRTKQERMRRQYLHTYIINLFTSFETYEINLHS